MADVTDHVLPREAELIPTKKGGRGRKALKPKDPTSNEANILAGNPSPSSQSQVLEDTGKENQEGLRLLLSPTNIKPATKQKSGKHAFAAELQQMQEKLEQMRIQKAKTEELLKERDEMLKRKEEELEARGKEQEKLQVELKKLQKLKEFKPTMTFPLVQSLREQEEEKKGKKKERPEIKRPSTAYALWCKDQWNKIKEEKPDADFKEISNILSSRWKNLNSEEKRPYEEKYQADKEKYLQIVGKERRENEAMKLLEAEQKQKVAMDLLDQYLEFKQEADKENKKTRKERDPLKPKKPLSAFFLYSNDHRPSLLSDNKSVLEVSKILGEQWKILPKENRAPYEEIAKKQKEEYLRQMELYKQKKNEEAAALQKQDEEQRKVQKQEALQLLKKKEKTENIIKKTKEKKKKQEQKVDPNKPRKPPTSFLLYSKETRKELLQTRPGIRNSTLQALISVKWKELAEDEKQLWNDKAATAVSAYKKELEEYKKMAAAVAGSNPNCESCSSAPC